MKYLLDTHIFIWYIDNDPKLSFSWKEIIRDPNNDLFLSVVSIWEATIKYHQGKLSLPNNPEIYLPENRIKHDIESLPVYESSVKVLSTLPECHRDPFDRMLISQSIDQGLTMITVDKMFQQYPVSLLT